jgi:hypothetical protein
LVATADVANAKLDTTVDRLAAATNEIEELKQLVKELQKAKRGLPFLGGS